VFPDNVKGIDLISILINDFHHDPDGHIDLDLMENVGSLDFLQAQRWMGRVLNKKLNGFGRLSGGFFIESFAWTRNRPGRLGPTYKVS